MAATQDELNDANSVIKTVSPYKSNEMMVQNFTVNKTENISSGGPPPGHMLMNANIQCDLDNVSPKESSTKGNNSIDDPEDVTVKDAEKFDMQKPGTRRMNKGTYVWKRWRPAIIESLDGDYAVIKYTTNGRLETVRTDMLQLLDDNRKRKRTATKFYEPV